MWQLIQAELRYHAIVILPLYAGLALLYALMTTDRLAYTPLIGALMLAIALLILLPRAKQNWERMISVLPVPPLAYFLARLISLFLITAGGVLVVGLLMLKATYATLHPVMFWRLISLCYVMAMYLIGAYTLADVKLEGDRHWHRFIYPGVVMFIWIIIYTMFIDTGMLSRLYEMLLPAAASSEQHLIFETPIGATIFALLNAGLLIINWLLFNKRTSFVGKK